MRISLLQYRLIALATRLSKLIILELWLGGFLRGEQYLPAVRAGVAQLVEHDVANVVVVGSNPITRSSRFLARTTAKWHGC